MPKWATVSLREELIDEIRRILKTGRYRSISEFVAEAIRLRLEEIPSSRGELVLKDSLDTTIAPEVAHARGYINTILDHSEQIWWVLVKLFEDLVQKDVKVHYEIIRELQNCRTLINSVRTHVCPDCDIEIANETIPHLQRTLAEVKHGLTALAVSVGDDYSKGWRETINKADRGELPYIIPTILSVPRFVPRLPRDPEKGWTRITLLKPVAKERVEDISRRLGVEAEFEGDLRIVVKGEKKQVKKAVETIYRAI